MKSSPVSLSTHWSEIANGRNCRASNGLNRAAFSLIFPSVPIGRGTRLPYCRSTRVKIASSRCPYSCSNVGTGSVLFQADRRRRYCRWRSSVLSYIRRVFGRAPKYRVSIRLCSSTKRPYSELCCFCRTLAVWRKYLTGLSVHIYSQINAHDFQVFPVNFE